MGLLDIFRGREPTNVKLRKKENENILQMVTLYGENYYSWNGNLYDSDIVRACIRPKVKAIGKMVGKHLVGSGAGMKVNPEARIRFLLEEPNPYMTGQMLQEKLVTQLMLNNNAFALIIRDQNGYPAAIYPVPAATAEAMYDEHGVLYIRFSYLNGKMATFCYDDLIHLRQDFAFNDVFGASPAPALTPLMQNVGVIDQGIEKAIKNSGIIRWLLKFSSSLRPEDIKRNTKDFVDNYLSYESETFGAAGVDVKTDAKQITPTDIMPSKAVAETIYNRIYNFFNVNESIIKSDFTEDQWNAYYQNEIEPTVIQLCDVFTIRLFTRRERGCGNRIHFESASLGYSSMATKLKLTEFLDRGIMNVNEIRSILSLPSIEGGDTYVRRLDTAPIDVNGETMTTEELAHDPEDEPTQETKKIETSDDEKGGVADGKNQYQRQDSPERL